VVIEMPGVGQHVPSVLAQCQLAHNFLPAKEYGKPFRTQQPLMAVGHDEVCLACLYIKLVGTETLDRINTKQDATLTAGGAENFQIKTQTVAILNRAD
jgi:hypothetical protein